MRPQFLFMGKKNDFYCERAKEFMALSCPDTVFLLGERRDPFPEDVGRWKGDYIISYLSPWIVPEAVLKRATLAAINFHPGPPEYPGTGCTNFAMYNCESSFGVTCHHMDTKVDTGRIIAVKRFPLFPEDTVYSLTQRCYSHILALFFDIISGIIQGIPLPTVGEHWKRSPYRRSELNALCEITADMDPSEISRRIRATTFPKAPGAFVEIKGVKFYYDSVLEATHSKRYSS